MAVPGELWAAGGVVLASAITYAGVRYTSNQTNKARVDSQLLATKTVDAAAYERARESYEAAIRQYRSEITRLEEHVSKLSLRIGELTDELLNLDESNRQHRESLLRMVVALEKARDDLRDHIVVCNSRIVRLRTRLESGDPIEPDDTDLHLF